MEQIRRYEGGARRFPREHPYWKCFSRAVVTAIFQSVAIIVLVNKAIIAIFVIEWISGWRHSRNTQMRVETNLVHFNVVWGLGKAIGALIGLGISTVWLNPHDPWWWYDYWAWPTVQWVRKLFP